jgi:hypothetical protein
VALLLRNVVRNFPINILVYLVFTVSAALLCSVLVAIGDSQVGLLFFTSLSSNIYHNKTIGVILFLFIYSLTVKKRLTY